ncbi:MAG: type IV pilus assembly protein PilC [Nitriliruptoraceae bacterium]|jgi:type IV pilus assembly protein PilC
MTSTFAYQVRDRAGTLVLGELEADTQAAVAEKLRSMGYAPISIEQKKEGLGSKELTIPGFGPKVGLKDLAIFSRQFATMISSGLSLLRALVILQEQTDNVKLAEVLETMTSDVEAGRSLSAAMADHDDFPKLYIALVRAGEAAGMLDRVLLQVADNLEKDVALRQKIKSAMTYPVLVLCMAIGLTAAMLIFIVPTFVGLFDTLGGDLPGPTKILLFASNFITSWAGVFTFLIGPIALWQAFKAYRKTDNGRFQLDVIKLKLPVFGELFHKIAITRFARNLAILLQSGVPILQALEIAAETVDNGVMSVAIKDVQSGVREGEAMAVPLAKHVVFPSMVTQMIAVGEETGAVDTMLNKISDFYDREIEATTDQLTAMMEPIMIAVLGAIVGSMVIALYMPIFEIMNLV